MPPSPSTRITAYFLSTIVPTGKCLGVKLAGGGAGAGTGFGGASLGPSSTVPLARTLPAGAGTAAPQLTQKTVESWLAVPHLGQVGKGTPSLWPRSSAPRAA